MRSVWQLLSRSRWFRTKLNFGRLNQIQKWERIANRDSGIYVVSATAAAHIRSRPTVGRNRTESLLRACRFIVTRLVAYTYTHTFEVASCIEETVDAHDQIHHHRVKERKKKFPLVAGSSPPDSSSHINESIVTTRNCLVLLLLLLRDSEMCVLYILHFPRDQRNI